MEVPNLANVKMSHSLVVLHRSIYDLTLPCADLEWNSGSKHLALLHAVCLALEAKSTGEILLC